MACQKNVGEPSQLFMPASHLGVFPPIDDGNGKLSVLPTVSEAALALFLLLEAIVGKRGVSIAVGAIVGRRNDDARRHVGGPGVLAI